MPVLKTTINTREIEVTDNPIEALNNCSATVMQTTQHPLTEPSALTHACFACVACFACFATLTKTLSGDKI